MDLRNYLSRNKSDYFRDKGYWQACEDMKPKSSKSIQLKVSSIINIDHETLKIINVIIILTNNVNFICLLID